MRATVAALKLPPHSIEAEQAVLGGVFARPELILDLGLTGDMFYRPENRAVWQAMAALAESGEPVDVLTVSDQLAASRALTSSVGLDYLADLATQASGANLPAYARIVRERSIDRRLISAGHEIAEMGFDTDGRTSAERVAAAQSLLMELDTPHGDDPVGLNDCLREAIGELERRHEAKGELLGLPTGFDALDRRTQGLAKGDLILVAGRPSSGKTTFAMNIAEHAALSGQLVIVFSLEMSRQQLTQRMLSSLGRIPFDLVRRADFRDEHWERVSSVVAKLRDRELFIDDNATLTSAQVLARATRIARKLKRKPALIVVDYLQLLNNKGEGVDRVSKISRNLKLAAKELDCPLIALSQLSRNCEHRTDKRPILADLRDSGGLEQDADIVFMIYRDEVYDSHTSRKGVAEILCRKFRNGEIGEDFLAANLSMCRFDNLQGVPPPPIKSAQKREAGFRYED